MTFDPTINVGHLIEVLLIIGSALTAYFKLDKRLSLLEDRMIRVQEDFDYIRGKVSMRGNPRRVES